MFKLNDLVYVKKKWFRKHQKRVGRIVEIVSDEEVKIIFDDQTISEININKIERIKNFAELFSKRADDPKLVESLAKQMMRLNPKILTEDKVGELLLKNNKFPKKFKVKLREIMAQYRARKEKSKQK